jgi:hypothetical protein
LYALNRKARCRNPLENLRRQHFLGVKCHQARYASRVVRQVEAGAEADFEHFSVHVSTVALSFAKASPPTLSSNNLGKMIRV